MPQPTVPQLYRAILRAARSYPSVKRDTIIQEIKVEFHANKAEADPAKVQKMRKLAVQSLDQLGEYVLDKRSASWDVQLTGGSNVFNN